MTTAAKIHALLTPAERRGAWMLLGWMIIGMVLETVGIGLVVPAIALLIKSDISKQYPHLRPVLAFLGNPGQAQLIVDGMLALIGIYLVKAAFLGFLAWRQTKFAFDVGAELSQRLFTIYLRQPYTFHLQRNSALLIANIVTEVEQFSRNAVTPALILITEILVLAGISALLLVVEPLGALVVVVVVGVASWAFHQTTKARVAKWGVARQYHEGMRLQHLQQGLGGAKDVKLLGREDEFLVQYGSHNYVSARVGHLQNTLLLLPRLWLEVLAVSGLAALVVTMLVQGRNPISVVPTLALFGAAAFRLMPSVNRALNSIQSLRFGLPVVGTLYDETRLPAPPVVRPDRSTGAFTRTVQILGVTYRYPSSATPALKDLTVSINKGESVGFVGASGSGKSTLVDVILGLLPPSSGVVKVDDVDIQGAIRAWQNQIGYVPQSIFLTDDTLRRNVAFGLPDEQIDDEAVVRAIRAAQLDDFVEGQPDGLATIVGERGIRLSGGQRQRIGIARALYHDPAVLVLDEATSALDTATENNVMEAITALRGKKTILIVAHRLSTVIHCDRLFRLEDGRIVGEGTPGELLAAPIAAR